MTEMAREAAIVVALLVVNGLFAMSELAIVTARRARLQRLAEEGDDKAKAALELAARPAQFLSTVQVGITLVGTLAGVFGGATLAERLAPLLAGLPAIGPYADGAALAVVVASITFLSLILGELVPKRIALAHPEAVARLVARPMRWVATVGRPLVWLLTASTNAVLALVRFRASETPHVTQDDIRALIEQGTTTGAVRKEEQEILGRVLHLDDRPVAAAMVPRTAVHWVRAAAGEAEVRQLLVDEDPTWLLVCGDAIDDVHGVASAHELLTRMVAGAPFELGNAARPPLFVPETLSMLELLDRLRETDTPVAVVLDEFGGVLGMITLTSLLTHLLGDLPLGPGAHEAADAERQADGSWRLLGSAPVEEIEEALGVDRLGRRDRRDYHTLAGFLLSEFGRVPAVGESITSGGYRFEILRMDGPRIEAVSAHLLGAPAGPTGAADRLPS